jgi:hypothetical protein
MQEENLISNENTYCDTETAEARKLRYGKQAELERLISENKLNGINAKERIRFIRNFIFSQFPNVKGYNSVEFRPRDSIAFVRPWLLSNKKFMYPSGEELSQDLDDYFQNIDSLSQEVVKLENTGDRIKAARRLAAAVYSFGIILHPYPDGNGQTLRLLALSYLHEFAPEIYGRATLPQRFKKTRKGGGAIHGKEEFSILKQIPATLYSESDMEMLIKFQTQYLPTSVEKNGAPSSEERLAYLYNTFKEFIPNLQIPDKSEDAEKVLVDQILAASAEARNKLSAFGITKSILDQIKSMRNIGEASNIDLVRQYLEYSLKSSRGKEWLKEFVLSGKSLDQTDIHSDLRWVEMVEERSLRDVEKQMEELLDNIEGKKRISIKTKIIKLLANYS